MKIEGDTIIFKSEEHFFALEKSGKKPNTTRILSYKEYGFIEANKTQIKKIRILEVLIKNTEQQSFERELTDISYLGAFLGHILVAFLWRHKEE